MAMAERHIAETIPYGGGSVMVWGCICKPNLVTVQGNLNALRYEREILQASVLPHFENHVFVDLPIFMDDKARPQRARVVEFSRRNAVETIPWPSTSPDLNPIEHIWDMFGRRVRQRDPPVQTVRDLEATLHQELARLPQRQIQRLIQGMEETT